MKRLIFFVTVILICINDYAQYGNPYYNYGYQLGQQMGNSIVNSVQANRRAKAQQEAYNWNDRGMSYHDSRDYSNAIIAYKNALSLDSDPTIWCNLGMSYQAYGDYANARICYSNVPYGHPSYTTAQRALSDIATLEAQAKRQEQLKQATEWNDKGVDYYRNSNYSAAITAFRRSLDIDDDAVVWRNLGRACEANGDYTAAKAAYRKVPYGHESYDEVQGFIAQINRKENQEKSNAVVPESKSSPVASGEPKASDFRAAAEQGNAAAQHNLGVCYKNGYGVAKDDTQAVYWYRKSAEQGVAEAQYSLGSYKNGYGVAKDDTQAVYWYRKSAEQGNAAAQHNLGVCYKNGSGVAKDDTQAVYWYRKSAEQGVAEAQYSLGICYENGSGVAKDANTALYWYEKALENGGSDGEFKLFVIAALIRLKDAGYSSSRAKP